MPEHNQLAGPIYVELVYEAEDDTSEPISSAYIDGFACEADAWKACDELTQSPIVATSKDGASILVDPDQLVQIVLNKIPDACLFPGRCRLAIEQLVRMPAIHKPHKGRVDGIADQFLHPLGQCFCNFRGRRERQIFKLPRPSRTILRRNNEARRTGLVSSAAMPERSFRQH